MATITSLGFNIFSEWDGDGVREARGDLKLLNEDIRRVNNSRIRVVVDLDDSMAHQQLRRLDNATRNKAMQLKLDVDTVHAEEQLARVARDRTVNIDVDTHGLAGQLQGITAGFNGASGAASGFGGAAHHSGILAKLAMTAFAASLIVLPGLINMVGASMTVGLAGAFIAVAAIALKNNADIQASFERLKTQGIESVKAAALPMKDSLVAGMDSILAHVKLLEPAFKQAFGSASVAVKPLIDSVMHLVENAMPGVNDSLKNIQPVMLGVQKGAENFGTSMSNMFRHMSTGAEGLGMAMNVTFTHMGIMMENFGAAAGKMSQSGTLLWGELLASINAWVDGFLDGMADMMTVMAGPFGALLRTIGEQGGEAFRSVLPAMGKLVAVISEELKPSLDVLIPAFAMLAVQLLESLVPVVRALSPIVLGLATGFATLVRWLDPVMPVLGPIIVGFIAYHKIALVARVAAMAWAVAQTALNLAMSLNPIGLVVIAIAALVAGIVWVATKTEFFQTVWRITWTAVKAIAEVVWGWIQRTWDSLINNVRGAWDRFSDIFRASWNALWDTVKNVAMAIWDQIKRNWEFIINTVKSIWDRFSDVFRASWNALWDTVKNVAQAIWDQIKRNWEIITGAIRAIYDAFSSALRNAWDAFWNAIKSAGQAIWNAIKAAWESFTGAVRSVYDSFANALGSAWDGFWNRIKAVAEGVWNGLKSGFNEVKDSIIGTFDFLVDKVEEIWNRITGIFKGPVDQIKGIWDGVKGIFGLAAGGAAGTGTEVIRRAAGGPVFGAGTATSDSIPALLSNGEHVWTAAEVDAAGGHKAVHTMRQQVMAGKGYADGGPVEWMWARVKELQPSMQLTSSYRSSNDFHGQGKAIDVSNGSDTTPQMQALTRQIHDSWGRDTLELIHQPSAFNIKNGGNVGDGIGLYGAATMAQHRNHVHWAVARALDGQAGAPVGGAGSMSSGPSQAQIDAHHRAVEAIKEVINRTNETTATRNFGFGPISKNSNANIAEEAMRRKNQWGVTPYAGDVHGGGTKNVGEGAIRTIDALLASASAGGVGGNVGGTIPEGDRLRIINEALGLTRTPPPNTLQQWQAGMNTLISRESGWNPNAVNNSDSNAAKGTPSKGLAQVIQPTFDAHKVAGHNNIMAPVDNVAASINYIKSRYGDISNVQQANANMPPKGYKMGTNNALSGWHMVGEAGPEMVQFRGGEQVKSFNEIIAALKEAAGENGNQLATKLSADIKAALMKLGEQHAAQGNKLATSLEDCLERLLAEAGVNIPISVTGSGGNAQAMVEQVTAQLVPKLEMLIRQRVGG